MQFCAKKNIEIYIICVIQFFDNLDVDKNDIVRKARLTREQRRDGYNINK